jgi:hypothetical protein
MIASTVKRVDPSEGYTAACAYLSTFFYLAR